MERIRLVDLISSSSTSTKSSFRENGNNHEKVWETLKYLLTDPRRDCCAVVVHNRYILVAGGLSWYSSLSSVDIIDTATSKQGTSDPCCIFPGPRLTGPRTDCAMVVLGQRVYVVCGYGYNVEYLDLNDSGKGTDNKSTYSSLFWSGLSWTKHKELKLFDVGSCLVVSGGTISCGTNDICNTEDIVILDTKRNNVWTLPHRMSWCYISMHIGVTHSNGIVAMGFATKKGSSWYELTFYKERLPLMDKNSALFLRLLEKPHWSKLESKSSYLFVSCGCWKRRIWWEPIKSTMRYSYFVCAIACT